MSEDLQQYFPIPFPTKNEGRFGKGGKKNW